MSFPRQKCPGENWLGLKKKSENENFINFLVICNADQSWWRLKIEKYVCDEI